MADSPAFNPPSIQPKDNDPQVMKVPMANTDWGFRSSQAPAMRMELPVSHVKNGN